MSPIDLLIAVFDCLVDSSELYHNKLFKEENMKISKLLDKISSDDHGNRKLQQWFQPHIVGAGCTMISMEMNTFTKSISVVGTSMITTTFIDSWTFDSSANHSTPVLWQFLLTATQTELTKEKNKIKNPEKVCYFASISDSI